MALSSVNTVGYCKYPLCSNVIIEMLSPFRLSSVCLPVTLVNTTQPVEIFRNVSTPIGTLAVHWQPRKILRRSSQGNPSVGGVKRTRGSQI